MKLADAVELSQTDSRLICQVPILEDNEGPRWKFGYDNWNMDPSPDILLLGAWRHPSTGNNLVGGVNLHYISDTQRDSLASILPEIMQQKNLKARYWVGRSLLPEVFENFYRTYDSKYIRGVTQDVMFPKYSFLKTAQDWIKKKIGGIFKSKKRREAEAEPKYPTDLTSMQDRLDQAVSQLAKAPAPEELQDTPEMQTARDAFKDFQRKRTLQDIERQEDEPYLAAQQDLEQEQQGLKSPQEQLPTDQMQQPQVQPEPTPDEISRQLEQEEQNRRNNLSDPDNIVDPNMDLGEEVISYYSPVAGRYIFEKIQLTKMKMITEDVAALSTQLISLKTPLAAAAQRIYQQWELNEEGFDEEIGGGGICDEIAQEMGAILADNFIDYTDGGHDGDDHAYLIAYDNESSYVVDIPPHYYESGGGMSWEKVPDVIFTPDMVNIIETERPDWIENDLS
jgi:hypothetical protein